MLGAYYCIYCEKDFFFKSKYERHLLSARHQQLIAVLNFEEVSDDDGITSRIETVEDELGMVEKFDESEDIESDSDLNEVVLGS